MVKKFPKIVILPSFSQRLPHKFQVLANKLYFQHGASVSTPLLFSQWLLLLDFIGNFC